MASDNLRGALWMVASMAGFAAEDGFLKTAAQSLPLGEVMALIGAAGIVVFALMAWSQSEPALPAALLTRTMALRSGFEIVGRLFYALAITLTPLSTASAILQASPLVIVLGAALIFGEKVGVLRWLVIVAGFVGVLVILRPGMAGFSPLSCLALIGLIGFAGRDLATRAAPPALSNAQLGVAGFIMLALSGLILLVFTGTAALPDGPTALRVAAAALFGIAGYGCLTKAMRMGEVGVVTPFRYTRLLFAMAIGIAFFGERPDAMTLFGSAIIVTCGFVILTQRRRIA